MERARNRAHRRARDGRRAHRLRGGLSHGPVQRPARSAGARGRPGLFLPRGVAAADQPPVRAHERRRPGAADDARKPGPDLGLPRGADARCVL